jgi:hypothetical protein
MEGESSCSHLMRKGTIMKRPEYAEMQDGEIVRVYDYHYTGTVNVWPDAALDAYQLQVAWEELQAVPSYVEAQARAFASEE